VTRNSKEGKKRHDGASEFSRKEEQVKNFCQGLRKETRELKHKNIPEGMEIGYFRKGKNQI